MFGNPGVDRAADAGQPPRLLHLRPRASGTRRGRDGRRVRPGDRSPHARELHTAPGVGNAVGGIGNALANKAPLVITAGQQVRAQVTHQALLTNRDATVGPQPYVKWSHEPPRAQDVPGAIGRAIHHATLPPRGLVFVSIPMDDWDAEADEDRAVNAQRRVVEPLCPAGPGGARAARGGARVGTQPGAGGRPGHRRERGMAGRGRARREAAAAGVGLAGNGEQPDRVPGESPELRGRSAAGDRPARADAERPRRDPGRRHAGVPVLPVHPGSAAARGRVADRDHERPRRGRARADGRRDRRRRRARNAGARGSRRRVGSPRPGPTPGASGA